jgi:hypothetical protein
MPTMVVNLLKCVHKKSRFSEYKHARGNFEHAQDGVDHFTLLKKESKFRDKFSDMDKLLIELISSSDV